MSAIAPPLPARLHRALLYVQRWTPKIIYLICGLLFPKRRYGLGDGAETKTDARNINVFKVNIAGPSGRAV